MRRRAFAATMPAMARNKPGTKRDRSAAGRTAARAPLADGQMTRAQIRAKVTGILRRFLPDFDAAALAPDASLRKALAADSMDVLNLVVAIHDELGVDIPEADYGKIDTLDGCLDYLAAALAARHATGARPA
jgi:acyl carrier protein